jgi:uncharacterized protein YdhG (YjbR/CyaY superfamily)
VTSDEAPTTVAAYMDAAPPEVAERLRTLANLIRAAAPDAEERIAYGLPTWRDGENLVHLGAFKHHIGLYPGPEAIEAFAAALDGLRTSKGAIQLPHVRPLPLELVEAIVRWRVDAAKAKRRGA